MTTVKNSKLLDKIVILAFKIYFKKCSNYMKLMKLKFCFVLFVFGPMFHVSLGCPVLIDPSVFSYICHYFTRIPLKIKKSQN